MVVICAHACKSIPAVDCQSQTASCNALASEWLVSDTTQHVHTSTRHHQLHKPSHIEMSLTQGSEDDGAEMFGGATSPVRAPPPQKQSGKRGRPRASASAATPSKKPKAGAGAGKKGKQGPQVGGRSKQGSVRPTKGSQKQSNARAKGKKAKT